MAAGASLSHEDVTEQLSEPLDETANASVAGLGPASLTWPFVDTENVESLEKLGIKDTSPEIILMSTFMEIYTQEPSSFYKNHNFDFLIFQTQLDLVLKEIINQKIENDDILKEKILANYKEKMKVFYTNKQLIEEMYIDFSKVFDVFSLRENLKSKLEASPLISAASSQSETSSGQISLANSTMTQGTLGGTSYGVINDLFLRISREASRMGYSFSSSTVESFLKSNEDLSSLDESFFSQNKYYNFLFSTIVRRSFFGYTAKDISPSINNFSPVISGEGRTHRRLLSEIVHVSRNLKAASIRFNTSNTWGSLSNGASIPTSPTSGEWVAYGRNILGNPGESAGKDAIVNLRRLKVENNISVNVYNNSQSSQSPSTRTGLSYFSQDLIKVISNGENIQNSQISKYTSNLKEKIDLFKGGIENLFDKTGTETFNTFIKHVAEVVARSFHFDKLYSNSSTINGVSGYYNQIWPRLVALSILAESYSGATEQNFYQWTSNTPDYVIVELSYNGAIFNFFLDSADRNQSRSSINIDSPSLQISFEKDPNSYTGLKGGGGYYEMTILGDKSSYDTSHEKTGAWGDSYSIYGYLQDFFFELKNAYFYSSLSSRNVKFEYYLKVALKTISYLFKDFKTYVRHGVESDGTDAKVLINTKGLQQIAAVKNILNDSLFYQFDTSKIVGQSITSSSSGVVDIKRLYRDATYSFFQSYNIVKSFSDYLGKIQTAINGLSSAYSGINEIFDQESLSLSSLGSPSVEKLTNLNTGYKRIFSPTSCFNEKPSYFSYENSLTSNDMIVVNSLHTQNPRVTDIDPGFEGMRFVAVGIPDGLIDNLRKKSGRTTKNSIIEINLLSLDHRQGNDSDTAKFTCRFKFLFNSCLHINTVNPEIDILSAANQEELINYNDILNIDNRGSFLDFDINQENLMTFDFGKITNNQFELNQIRSIDDAIKFNRNNYSIINNYNDNGDLEYNFNMSMSANIIKNHIVSYALKRNFEIFNGAFLSENNFSYIGNDIIDLNTSSGASRDLTEYFETTDYSPELKMYLKNLSKTSPIINPDSFIKKSYAFTKFDRVFFLPCFRSKDKNANQYLIEEGSDFIFKSLIPTIRLL